MEQIKNLKKNKKLTAEERLTSIKTISDLNEFFNNYPPETLTKNTWTVLSGKPVFKDISVAKKYKDYLDWEIISILEPSEAFLKEFKDKIEWIIISMTYTIPNKSFVMKFKKQLRYSFLILNESVRNNKSLLKEIDDIYSTTSKSQTIMSAEDANKIINEKQVKEEKIEEKFIIKKTASKNLEKPKINLESLSKSELKEILTKANIRVYYHDTIPILIEKIKSAGLV